MDDWAEVHQPFLQYEPSAVGRCGKPAADIWSEVQLVAGVGAWRSVSALSGQLLELILKHALVERGAKESVGSKTLGQLMPTAERLGLFAAPTESTTVAASISTATELRNLASHGSPWQREPSPQRAAYSLVFLSCFSGYLFPRSSAASEPLEEFDATVARPELDRVSNTFETLAGSADTDATVRVRTSTPRGLLRWWKVVEEGRTEDQVDIVDLVTKNFPYIIENIGFGRARSVYDFARKLQDRQLSCLSRCCGILLPHDPRALSYFASRSPAFFSKYLYECKRAEPTLFSKRYYRHRLDTVVGIATGWLSDESIALSNAANLLSLFPHDAIRRFIDTNRHQLRSRVLQSRPADSVSVLRLLDVCNPGQAAVSSLTDAIVEICTTGEVGLVSAVPLRLHQLGLADSSIATRVVRVLLMRATEVPESPASARIVWDLSMFSSRFGAAAVETATSLCGTLGEGDQAWYQLLVRSVPLVTGRDVQLAEGDTRFDDLGLPWPSGSTDRFQQLRVGFVLEHGHVALPEALREHLGRLAASTVVTPAGSKTAAFVNRCRALWPVDRPKPALL